MGTLDEKGGMPDPGQANLSVLQLGKNRGSPVAVTPLARKQSWQKNIRNEPMGTVSPDGRGLGFHEREMVGRKWV